MKATVLHDTHVSEGAKMVSFNGWHMPVQYRSINHEHQSVRSNVAVFDVSHMGQIRVVGPDSVDFLQRLLPADVASLSLGQMKYSVMCNHEGGVVDDLAAYRLDEDEFLLVVNAGRTNADCNWIREAALGADVHVEDRTHLTGMLALQGPRAEDVIADHFGDEMRDLDYFRFADARFGGHDAIVSRSGYTGEDGFEIMSPVENVVNLWKAFRASAVSPAGLGARNTLRMEMGYCLYGHELTEGITPLQARLGRILCLDSTEKNFIGRDALVVQRESGGFRELTGLVMKERAVPRAGYEVTCDGTSVGIVSSGTHAPTLGKGIALAFVDEFAAGIDSLSVDVRGQARCAEVVPLPFVPSHVRTKRSQSKGV